MTRERAKKARRTTLPDMRPAWLPARAGTVAALAFLAGWGWYGIVLGGHAVEVTDAVSETTGFSIKEVRISGQKEIEEREILSALAIPEKNSLFTYDIASAYSRVSDIPWVKQISIRKLYPATLQVTVKEREPFALWQRGQVLSVIDRDGRVIADTIRPRYAGLPMIVGHGGQKRAAEYVTLLDRFPTLKPRVNAGVLVAERRWNLVLDNGIEVRLPEKGVNAALKELVALDNEHGLLSRDITAVDLRLDDRIIVRLSEGAAEARREFIKKGGLTAGAET
ncbi:cell division protein FtsQ [Rhodobium orientis]|nr:cell division protein FtsQ/DivIB [Rhodobium orientis]MBB4305457.1 cell division protein FtsQ [Rhodobium orientis]